MKLSLFASYCVCFANTLIANFVGVVKLSHYAFSPSITLVLSLYQYMNVSLSLMVFLNTIKCLMSAAPNKYK